MHLTYLPLTLAFLLQFASAAKNNVCRNHPDYAAIDLSGKCWHNPDVGATPASIIKNHGYGLEEYQVITKDGYILYVYRILGKKAVNSKKQVVYLQHGMGSDAAFWVNFGKRALAFLLADAGYDVWVGNVRGSPASRGHVKADISDKEYWNFSFDDMGNYDIPATLDKVSEVSGRFDIIYIAHSMGTSMGLVYCTMQSEHANRHLKAMIFLAPIANINKITSSARLLMPVRNQLVGFLNFAGTFALADQPANETSSNSRCGEFLFMQPCIETWFSIFGYDRDQLAYEDVPVIFNNLVAAVSTKTLAHLAQIIAAKGRFQRYDYGMEENKKRYGSNAPPIYNIESINLPVHLYHGEADALSVKEDVIRLYQTLNNPKSLTHITTDGSAKFHHLDFATAKNITTLLHLPLLARIESLSN